MMQPVSVEVEFSNLRFRKAKLAVLIFVPTIFATVFLYPIALSGLSGDDIPNSMRSAALQANDWSRWELIKLTITQWKTNEGRFFPIAAIENLFIFDFIHSVSLYKTLQLFVTVSLLVVAAAFITKIVDSWKLFPLVLFLLLSCIQTRNWYDPTLGFGLLLQSVQIKILACFYALCYFLQGRGNKLFWCLSGCTVLWLAALLQYEVVITLFPTSVILIIFLPGDRLHKLIAFVAIGLPTAIYVLYVAQLRAGVSATAAYTVHADLGLVSLAYLKQLSGGVPFSAMIWSRGAGSFLAALSELPLLHLLLLTATVCLAVTYRLKLAELSSRRALVVFMVGLNFVLGPAITTAVSSRWQNEVAWGLSYLSVSFTYTGVAFIAFSVLFVFSRWSIKRPVMSTVALGLSLTFFALSAVSNHSLLNDNASATKLARDQRDTYVLAVREGFLSRVPTGSIIVYPSFDENYWVNEYFTEWLGGPKKLVFVKRAEEAQKNCSANVLFEPCPRTFYLEYIPTNNWSIVLSLFELNNRSIESQLSHWYFSQHLPSEELQTICLRPIREKTRKGVMYSCNRF